MEQMPSKKEVVIAIIGQWLLLAVIVFGSAGAVLFFQRGSAAEEAERADAILRENTRAMNCTEPLKEGQLAFPDCKPGEAGYDKKAVDVRRE